MVLPSRNDKFVSCVKMEPSSTSVTISSALPCNFAGELPRNESPTVVVNVRHEKPDVYCGRPSIYGNPYRIGKDGTRVDVILKYIDYFFDRMAKDVEFRNAIYALKGKRIGCWCHPNLCHLHVIAYYLNHYVSLQ